MRTIIADKEENSIVGLFQTFQSKGFSLPDSRLFHVETSPIHEGNYLENVFDYNGITFWYSRSYQPYFRVNFGQNKVSLSSFYIYGISNPYTIALNISGSNNGKDWTLIEEYPDLGEQLHSQPKLFTLNEQTELYSQIKLQSIKSKSERSGNEHELYFGIRDLEFYGVFIPKGSIHLMTCQRHSFIIHSIYIFVFIQILIDS